MLRQIPFFLPIVMLLLSACGSKKTEITYLNDQLITINDSLFYKGQAWGEEFKIALNTGDFSKLPAARMEVLTYIESGIERVKALEDVGGSEKLRKAELDYLYFEKDSIAARMASFEQFTSATPQDVISAAYLGLVNSSKEEQARLTYLRKMQKQYADKNDIELKESTLSLVE